jgi:predicted transcriptional regulator
MSSFNRIFDAVKKHCEDSGAVTGNNQLQKIAGEAGVTIDRLHFYLECLQETGVIKYNATEKTVTLTEKGAKALRVFP